MKAQFTLTTAEGKRIIGKAVANLSEVNKALKEHKIIIAGGTTNGYVAEELLHKEMDKVKYTAGIITRGVQCLTPLEERIAPIVLEKGQVSDIPWTEAINEFTSNDIFVKGANAIDNEGNAGVLAADPFGGTIGKAMGIIFSRGSKLIIPVGLEKMVPSVKDAIEFAGGIKSIDCNLGMAAGLIPIVGGIRITEKEALSNLLNVKATCLSAGGVGGSEGAITFGIEGAEGDVLKAISFIKDIKGEPNLKGLKQKCQCKNPCDLW